MHQEAEVIIQGVRLSKGECVTLRVALNSFLMDMKEDDALGDDDHGRIMVAAYREHGKKVLKMLTTP